MKKEIIINGKKKDKIENINLINKETIELNLESKKEKKNDTPKIIDIQKGKFIETPKEKKNVTPKIIDIQKGNFIESSKENNNENKEENNNI